MKIILGIVGFSLLLATSGCLVEDEGGHERHHDRDHDEGHAAILIAPPVVIVH
jgi:hypothetical protein